MNSVDVTYESSLNTYLFTLHPPNSSNRIESNTEFIIWKPIRNSVQFDLMAIESNWEIGNRFEFDIIEYIKFCIKPIRYSIRFDIRSNTELRNPPLLSSALSTLLSKAKMRCGIMRSNIQKKTSGLMRMTSLWTMASG